MQATAGNQTIKYKFVVFTPQQEAAAQTAAAGGSTQVLLPLLLIAYNLRPAATASMEFTGK